MAPIPGSSPTTADWLSAWSTFGAAVGTVGAFFTGLSLWWRDRRRLRRAHARLVHGYIVYKGYGLVMAHGDDVLTAPTTPKYVIENNGDEPIFRVSVPHLSGGDAIRYELIPAGEKREKAMSRDESDAFRAQHSTATVIPLAFSFADAASALWRRTDTGRLRGGWRYRWPRKG